MGTSKVFWFAAGFAVCLSVLVAYNAIVAQAESPPQKQSEEVSDQLPDIFKTGELVTILGTPGDKNRYVFRILATHGNWVRMETLDTKLNRVEYPPAWCCVAADGQACWCKWADVKDKFK